MSMNHGAIPILTGLPGNPPAFGQFRSGLPVTLDDRLRPRLTEPNPAPVTGVVVHLFDAGSKIVGIADADGKEHIVAHHWIVPTPDGWPDIPLWNVRRLAAMRDADTPPLFGGDEPKTPRGPQAHP